MKLEALYQQVTAQIIAELERGAAPWVKCWTPNVAVMPQNAITRRPYNGINVLILWLTAQFRLYPTNAWLTFKQALEGGGCVRKGEKGTAIVFTKQLPRKDEEDEEERARRVLKTYYVFNEAQIDGLERSQEPQNAPRMPVMPFVEATGATVLHGHSMACYAPSQDAVCMPNPGDFQTPEHYQATLLHELTHWTGHKTRLDRDLKHRFGSREYAAEELVAELGAAFLCAHLGISGQLRHAGYIEHWLELLREDERAIFTASAKASQAADYLRQFSEKEELPCAA